jgi:hypothetical protein
MLYTPAESGGFMKQFATLWAAVVILLISVFFLFLKIRALEEQAPGLGEYMTTIQLHAGKLWFAAKGANWELAEYEVDEMKETMEAAKGLGGEKNGVKIASVLDSVLKTQVAALEKTVKAKNPGQFQKSYDETLSACNGCHSDAGYKFIQIVRPTAPPVTNQRFQPETKKTK